ncbi:MAG: PAS domain-containing protein, partial [Pseudomonadota bacterium]|nr:PAS domain-containing protein [Pseudomonadota bacterium]
MTRLSEKRTPVRRAAWVALLYLLAGLAWIAFSDRAVEAWFPDPQTLSLIQTWKGFLFVLTTGAVLFLVLLRQLAKDRSLLALQHAQREALRKRERQLQVLMDNLPGMAYRCRFDDQWTMLFVSQGCARLTGYRPEDLVDNRRVSYASLIDSEDNEQIVADVRAAVARGESFSREYGLTRQDGSRIWGWERGRGVGEE